MTIRTVDDITDILIQLRDFIEDRGGLGYAEWLEDLEAARAYIRKSDALLRLSHDALQWEALRIHVEGE